MNCILGMFIHFDIFLYSIMRRMRMMPIEDYQEDLSLSSILLISPCEDVSKYPDYQPVHFHSSPSTSMAIKSSSANPLLLTKYQRKMQFYQFYTFSPTLITGVASPQRALPSSVEHMVFQEGVPIRVAKQKEKCDVKNAITFGSFVVYSENGDMVRE